MAEEVSALFANANDTNNGDYSERSLCAGCFIRKKLRKVISGLREPRHREVKDRGPRLHSKATAARRGFEPWRSGSGVSYFLPSPILRYPACSSVLVSS